MIRGEIPRLFPKENPTVFGQSRKLSEGNKVASKIVEDLKQDVENLKKKGKYDPVTNIDRAFEKFIRNEINKKFPSHQIIGHWNFCLRPTN